MTVTEADYMDLVDRKTASLFSACARLGAMAAGASEEVEARLGEYAWNLGMAFQLVDDVLDFTAHETVLGKPVGSDLREGKVTLPLIYSMKQADAGRAPAGGDDSRATAITAARRSPSILALIERHHGIERAMRRAEAFTEKAREIIGGFPDSPLPARPPRPDRAGHRPGPLSCLLT